MRRAQAKSRKLRAEREAAAVTRDQRGRGVKRLRGQLASAILGALPSQLTRV